MAGGSSGRFKELLGIVMKSEVLDELPEVHPDRERTSVFSKIMRSEVLPFDEQDGVKRRAPLAPGLFATETLPYDEPAESRRGRIPFMTTLFSREELSQDPREGARQGAQATTRGRDHGTRA